MEPFLVTTFLILLSVLILWGLLDVFYRHYKKDPTVEMYWIFIILLFPFLGALLYFHRKHSQRRKSSLFSQRI
ncbi:PLD nuclease N-terminal domain-containing protein [Capnocytophaga sp. oral taxon 380]|uniref:PLDc N-terminal domain-containing protein n=1 Tax=unclassified Capnocytophaga TaxID=2640652 RepID=UPI0009F9631D